MIYCKIFCKRVVFGHFGQLMSQKERLVTVKKNMKVCPKKKKWKRMKYWCCQEFTGDDWDKIIEWAKKHWKGKSLKCVCSKLGFSEVI